MHHGIPAVLRRDEPWLHRHSENGALISKLVTEIFLFESVNGRTYAQTDGGLFEFQSVSSSCEPSAQVS